MKSTYSALALLAVLAVTPAQAQDTTPAEPETSAETATDTPAEAPAEDAAPDTGGLSMGEPETNGSTVGQPYVKQEFDAWQLRCINTETGMDPCQLYQLLKDEGGNPVAEFAVFPLIPAQGEAIAGGTIIAPLQTLLTETVRLQVDGGEARRYPFAFCTEIGCFARVGYSADDINRFKAGTSATVTIVPALAPTERIGLAVSLKGFTAGYTALQTQMQEMYDAAQASDAAAPEGGN
jgi:invasion protein IalB